MKKKKLFKKNMNIHKIELYDNITNENCPQGGGNCNCPQYNGQNCVSTCGKKQAVVLWKGIEYLSNHFSKENNI